jgi:serine/threonine-protein kinase
VPTDRTLRLAAATDATGSSFHEELREFVFHRCRLLVWIGLGIIALGFVDVIVGAEPLTPTSGPLRFPQRLVHLGSAFLGLGLLYLRRDSLRWLWGIAVVFFGFNMALWVLRQAVTEPAGEPFLIVSLLLFAHAALIPNRRTQVWLVLSALAAVLLSYLLPYGFVSEIREFWSGAGGQRGMAEHAIQVTIKTAVIAAISLVVSFNLYRLQKSAHEAKKLGNHFIERELGAGGMGKVYVARHAMIRRPTAVKVLTLPEGDRGGALARFEREVQLSASLAHPNTITIYDYGRTADDTFYYAMEYLDGFDLQQMVERFGPLPAARAVHLLTQACGSLTEAHERGIVHRDIKPSNIFVTRLGGVPDFVKVLDFGIAREVEPFDGDALTQTGVVLGTPRYMPPEVLQGAATAEARSDIYSLGGVAYWMLSGRPLFESSTGVQVLVDHLHTTPPRPTEICETTIPRPIEDVVMRCLAKDPAHRYASAAALDAALRAASADEWTSAEAREWWDLHGQIPNNRSPNDQLPITVPS